MHQKRPKSRRTAAGNRQAEPATSTPANIERATAATTDRPTDEPRPDQPKEVFTPPLESRAICKRENTNDRAVFIGDLYNPTDPPTKPPEPQ